MRFVPAVLIALVAATAPATAQQRRVQPAAKPNPKLEQYRREATQEVDARTGGLIRLRKRVCRRPYQARVEKVDTPGLRSVT